MGYNHEATAEAPAKRINELEAENAALKQMLSDQRGVAHKELGRLLAAQHRIRELRKVGEAVVARWETPLWKDVPSTANYIYALRDALAKTDSTAEIDALVKDAKEWRDFQRKLKDATAVGSGFIAARDTNLAKL